MELIGVYHGMQNINILGETQEIKVIPSAELFQKLESLPGGTRIGIECMEPEDLATWHFGSIEFRRTIKDEYGSYDIPWKIQNHQLEGLKYWKDICQSIPKNAEIVYLDKPEMYIPSWKRFFEAYDFQKRVEQACNCGMFSEAIEVSDEEIEKIPQNKAEAHRLMVEGRYLHEVIREQ